jgi:hypothetical protein
MLVEAAFEHFLDPMPSVEALLRERLDGVHARFDHLERDMRIVEAGLVQRLQEGPGGREGVPKFPLVWDHMVSCVCHQTAVRPPSTGRSIPAT